MQPSYTPRFTVIEHPRNVVPVIELLKIGPNDRYTLAICSPKVYGVVTHWDGEKTRPCLACSGSCALCEAQTPKRDKGYLLVANTAGQLRGFLELTPLAWFELEKVRPESGTYRGLVVEVRRANAAKRGRLLVEPVGRYQGPAELPKDRRPDQTLSRIFNRG
jgi:hypothetical protein